MEYLKAFTIGTSGPVWVQHIALLALADENYYDYSFKGYSLVAPIYYGLMTMLALFLGKIFNWSLQKRLLITSIISIILVLFLGYMIKAYNYSPKEQVKNVIDHILRHLVAFNLIIYNLTKYFSDYYWLRVFVVGSSIFSYFITYLKVIWLDNKNKVNYNYKFFAIVEPFIEGFNLVFWLYILQNIFGFELKVSLILKAILGSFVWLLLAYNFKTYNHQGMEWIYSFFRVIISGSIRMGFMYYLLKNLK